MIFNGLNEIKNIKEIIKNNIFTDIEKMTVELINLQNKGELLRFSFLDRTSLKLSLNLKNNQQVILGGKEIELLNMSVFKPVSNMFGNAKISEETKETLKQFNEYLYTINTLSNNTIPNLKDIHDYSKSNLNPYNENRKPLLPKSLSHLAPPVEVIKYPKKFKY